MHGTKNLTLLSLDRFYLWEYVYSAFRYMHSCVLYNVLVWIFAPFIMDLLAIATITTSNNAITTTFSFCFAGKFLYSYAGSHESELCRNC